MIQSGNRRALLSPHPHRRSDEWEDGLQTLLRAPGERPLLLPISAPLPARSRSGRRGAGHYFASAVVPGTLFRGSLPRPRRRKETRSQPRVDGRRSTTGRARRRPAWALRRPWGLSVWCVVCARVHVDLQSGCETERSGEG